MEIRVSKNSIYGSPLGARVMREEMRRRSLHRDLKVVAEFFFSKLDVYKEDTRSEARVVDGSEEIGVKLV